MPTTIYDSSQITKRRAQKTISGSFINRIQNPTNPTTGYAPILGISEQSIINEVKAGQMTEYRKNDGGCTSISVGCPCQSISNVDESLLPVLIGGFVVTTGNSQTYIFGFEDSIQLGRDGSPILYYQLTTIIGGQTQTINTFYPQMINTNGGITTYFSVTAFNRYGASNTIENNLNNNISFTVSPKAPTISVTNVTNNSVTIQVIADSYTGASSLTNLRHIFFNTTFGLIQSSSTTIIYTGSPQSVTISSLTPNTKYAIGFRSINSSITPIFGIAISSLSNVVEFTTLP
jgi:hypothetical protein